MATLLDRELGGTAARDQLGHSSQTVTDDHYIERNRSIEDHSDILRVMYIGE
ncbi:hypothetical protein [Lysinibacter sp. HNR]|uniref:hypothetical protein n=1 Tax=Lysinibacter sp. HNR TaxID=3031408 RepID=UPI002434C07E|nr:hypothetical protein [Lysinibacter sp. HNR]WGD38542.1 hypothetical protein FrondiHNR_06455 [Lysinibacter sp. HNR]